jgi:hypothetical protein
MKKRRAKRALIIIGSILLIVGLIIGYYFLFMNPRRGTVKNFAPSQDLDTTLSRRQAEEDLQFLFQHLQSRHPAWLDGSEDLRQAVTDQYHIEIDNLSEQITVLDLWQAAGRMLAKLQDGHTWINWQSAGEKRYINDFTQVQSLDHPLYINGLPTEEVLAKYLSQSSYELAFYAEERFYQRALVEEDMLRWSGVDTSDGVDMTFLTEEGETTFHYIFVPLDQVIGYEPTDQDEDWVYYSIDAANDLGVFTLKSCRINDEYRAVLQAFFDEVFANQIGNIVVDLRGNGGGNSRVANEFLKYIRVESYKTWDSAVRYGWYLHKNKGTTIHNQEKPQTFDGNIYVLTDTFTYSSAMDFAMLIGDNRLGMLVGSTSGNRPDGYGDSLHFQLPNSGLTFSVSFKRWYRMDQSKSGQPLTPDVVVAPNEALEKVYELIRNEN